MSKSGKGRWAAMKLSLPHTGTVCSKGQIAPNAEQATWTTSDPTEASKQWVHGVQGCRLPMFLLMPAACHLW